MHILPVLCALSLSTAAVIAGPINPPSGPVTSSGKTLTEVEPRIPIKPATTPGDADSVYKITASGHYYLIGNISVRGAEHGIEVTNSHVTIDLNGFTISSTSSTSLTGIIATNAAAENIRIRNGTITGLAGAGIDLSLIPNCRVEDMTVAGCLGRGIDLGIGRESIVEGCIVTDNRQAGIRADTVRHSIARNNGDFGIDGYRVDTCVASDNGGVGIKGQDVSLCAAAVNTTDGIVVNSSHAARLSTARANGGFGFVSTLRSTISECNASFNGQGGISANFSVVSGHVRTSNGTATTTGAGILVSGASRVEGNHCCDNDRGYRATGTDNLLVRNSASRNTINFMFDVENYYGIIVDRRVPQAIASTPAVLQGYGSSTVGTTEANANIAY
jgi:hypothetical protein